MRTLCAGRMNKYKKNPSTIRKRKFHPETFSILSRFLCLMHIETEFFFFFLCFLLVKSIDTLQRTRTKDESPTNLCAHKYSVENVWALF